MDGKQEQAALKEMFDRARLQAIGDAAFALSPAFDRRRFLAVATEGLDGLGIMQRMRRTAEALQAGLDLDFARAAPFLRDLAPRVGHGFAAVALCEHVALYGRGQFALAMQTLAALTPYGSAEFAIRPFLRDAFGRTLAVMRGWAEHEDEHVRRLASEGCRPRLPWSFRLQPAIADPSLTFPIPERLRADPSDYVRRSAANHLNDISRDHPGWLLDRIAAWPEGDGPERRAVRHALRTLVKAGDPRALAIVGASGPAEVVVERFAVSPPSLRLGGRVSVGGEIVSTGAAAQRLVVDYAVHYVKKGGKTSRKVFKLREIELAPGERSAFAIAQTIRDFTTRTHNAGFHRVELLVNGTTLAESGFDLSD